jgi:hypothetical protein
MLAQIAYTERHGRKLLTPSALLPDEVVRFVYECVATAPSDYFTARESAFADPTAGERYATLMLDSLISARRTIEEARLRYRNNEDLDSLLRAALPPISFVLGHAAEWLGHRDGLPEQDDFPGASLAAELRVFELRNWLELFGRDLRALYSADDHFTSARILALSQHAERLLWTVQIFPWPMEDGSLYVSVPWGADGSA